MKTQLLDNIQSAAAILRAGGLVAFPTETVFGLGADARNAEAVAKIFAAKGRPSDNPLIVHVADRQQWPLAARQLTAVGSRVLDLFAPGPVTVVLPKATSLCAQVTAGLDSVGLRVPAAEITRELLRQAGIPIAAPSANRSGRPSGTTWQSVLEDLDGHIDAVLCLEVPHVGLESSVIDCLGPSPILLRPGAVGLAALRAHFPDARQVLTVSGDGSDDDTDTDVERAHRPSPGMQHPHYQPRARVKLIDREEKEKMAAVLAEWAKEEPAARSKFAYAGLTAAPAGMILSEQYGSLDAYAQGFYEFLRRADRAGAEVVLLEAISLADAEHIGVAAALRDRQQRAAGQT